MHRRDFLAGSVLALGGLGVSDPTTDAMGMPVRVIDKIDKIIKPGEHYELLHPVVYDGWYLVSGKIRLNVSGWRFMFVNDNGQNTTGVTSVAGWHHAGSYQMWAAAGTWVGIRAEVPAKNHLTGAGLFQTGQLKIVRLGGSRGTRIVKEGVVR